MGSCLGSYQDMPIGQVALPLLWGRTKARAPIYLKQPMPRRYSYKDALEDLLLHLANPEDEDLKHEAALGIYTVLRDAKYEHPELAAPWVQARKMANDLDPSVGKSCTWPPMPGDV